VRRRSRNLRCGHGSRRGRREDTGERTTTEVVVLKSYDSTVLSCLVARVFVRVSVSVSLEGEPGWKRRCLLSTGEWAGDFGEGARDSSDARHVCSSTPIPDPRGGSLRSKSLSGLKADSSLPSSLRLRFYGVLSSLGLLNKNAKILFLVGGPVMSLGGSLLVRSGGPRGDRSALDRRERPDPPGASSRSWKLTLFFFFFFFFFILGCWWCVASPRSLLAGSR